MISRIFNSMAMRCRYIYAMNRKKAKRNAEIGHRRTIGATCRWSDLIRLEKK